MTHMTKNTTHDPKRVHAYPIPVKVSDSTRGKWWHNTAQNRTASHRIAQLSDVPVVLITSVCHRQTQLEARCPGSNDMF